MHALGLDKIQMIQLKTHHFYKIYLNRYYSVNKGLKYLLQLQIIGSHSITPVPLFLNQNYDRHHFCVKTQEFPDDLLFFRSTGRRKQVFLL